MVSIRNMFIEKNKSDCEKGLLLVFNSAVGKMEDGYSEGRGFERVLGTFPFVDMKISNQHHATRVGLCSRVCLGVEKWQLFSLCSNSSFRSLGFFFVFYFKPLNDGFS